jgi:hypothetical protein
MKQNEGTIDRIIRGVTGLGLTAGGFFTAGTVAIVLWVLGGVMLFTAISGICLFYIPFGFSTKKN